MRRFSTLQPHRSLALAALLILPTWFGAATSHADIYRWVDQSGVVNYTQQRPYGIESVKVDRIGAKAPRRAARAQETPVAPTPGSETEEDLSAAQQAKLAELKAKQAADAMKLVEQRQENCRQAETLLSQLTTRSRIRMRAEDGTERAIGEDERQERISDAQLRIAQNCVQG